MLGFRKQSAEHSAALNRLRQWTQARFALSADTTILATEIACAVPGCPPVETHVVFWTARGSHHFKIFKPAVETTEDDLPPAFMKDALVSLDPVECACCG